MKNFYKCRSCKSKIPLNNYCLFGTDFDGKPHSAANCIPQRIAEIIAYQNAALLMADELIELGDSLTITNSQADTGKLAKYAGLYKHYKIARKNM